MKLFMEIKKQAMIVKVTSLLKIIDKYDHLNDNVNYSKDLSY